ncbi:hypothetical protein [Rheinheimera tilapiae]|uniref:Uncharacterized protein n=1 Tax=Rheinheimera tilapiae TaxID=875043 RepID=A0ABV6BIM8_9GAMM
MRCFTAFVAVCSLSIAANATAGSLQQCRAITDSAARLLCYDQLVDAAAEPTSAAAVAPTVPVSPAVTTSEAAPVAASVSVQNRDEALFGTSGETIESAIADLTVQVKAVAQDSRQKLLLTMSNGQRWLQLDQAFLKVSAGDSCVISSGVFGSFTLKCQQGRKAIKVKRLQ